MQNSVDVGRRKVGLRREGIFRYFLCSILFLYSCSRLQVTPEDQSRPFMAQNASVVVLGLGVSSRTNFESLALVLKVKSLALVLALKVKALSKSPWP